MKRDTLQVVLSDMHSGSNYALFVSNSWQGKKTQISHPRSNQVKIRNHFEAFGERVRKLRKNKTVVLVHNGDAIDGDHHHSNDVCTHDQLEQADIHIELMTEFQKMIDWQRGDQLYYVRGTSVHVGEYEDYIARQTNSIMQEGKYAWDVLNLRINGALSWFLHHGPRKGNGANRGNTLRNWLRAIYYEALEDNRPFPDIVYTGHVHNPDFATYDARLPDFKFKTMHGIILPSWQNKTAYAYEKAPINVNRIGGVVHEIKVDGTICVPEFFVMDS